MSPRPAAARTHCPLCDRLTAVRYDGRLYPHRRPRCFYSGMPVMPGRLMFLAVHHQHQRAAA